MKTITKLWVLIVILAVLSPLGIIIPKYFKAGTAWGEWSSNEIKALVGCIPQGMAKFISLWKAPMAGYVLKGQDSSLSCSNTSYIISAVAGVIIIIAFIFLLGKFWKFKK